MTEIQLHPLCTLFPRLTGADFDALRDDIAANGLREPITTHDGMILDGGNRYAACLAAGVEPRFKKFTGDSIGAFVLSTNLHRRHLSAGQQAAIVASVQDWAKAQTVGKPKSAHVSTFADTTTTRAKTSGASVSTQRRADAVAKADPELAKQVAIGKTSLGEAVRQVAPKLAPRQAKPASSTPTVESLTAEVESLRLELEAVRANASELADMVKVQDVLSDGEAAAAKEIKRLMAELNTTRTQRDSYMTKCNEMVKTVNYWKRKAGAK